MSELSKSDRILANVILSEPNMVISETIGSLAERSGVSEPTISRFCKKFGASGFADFKNLVASSIQTTAPAIDTSSTIKTGDSVESVCRKVVDNTINSLSSLTDSLDLQAVARSIDIISQSRRIVIVAQGLSIPTAFDMQLRLLRIGIACEIASDKAFMQVIASTLHHNDLLIAISMTGKSVDVIKAANRAREGGAYVLGISPNLSLLSKSCMINLHSGGSDYVDDNMMVYRTTQKVIAQILISGVMLRRYDTIQEMKDRVDDAYYDIYTKDINEKKISEDNDTLYNPSAPITTLPH